MAWGIPDEVFWNSTPYEVGILFDATIERHSALEKNANLRAGLIASTIYNVHSKGRTFKPSDFLREPPKVVSPEDLEKALDNWMK